MPQSPSIHTVLKVGAVTAMSAECLLCAAILFYGYCDTGNTQNEINNVIFASSDWAKTNPIAAFVFLSLISAVNLGVCVAMITACGLFSTEKYRGYQRVRPAPEPIVF